jgi:peptidoglycan L-alanyl-D-glutamate endopeptidase CwlK
MQFFSQLSLSRLNECHPDLQKLFKTIIEFKDCSILVGHRGEEDQNRAVTEGKSKLKYPMSKHNSEPSMAVDVALHPLPDWKNVNDFIHFGGYVQGVAALLYEQGMMCHKIRWGGDWDQDGLTSDNKFADYVHFELVPSNEKK